MLAVRPALRWRQQPPAGFSVDLGNPLTRGLEFCAAGSLRYDRVRGLTNSITGTKPAGTVNGMAAGFDTAGTGAADIIRTPYTHSPMQRTFLALANAFSTGVGLGFGRLLDKSSDTTYDETIACNDGGTWLAFGRKWSGANASWNLGPAGTMPKRFYNLILTYDASSATNNPAFYVNGTSASVAVSTGPSGTVLANTSPLNIGNRGVDSAHAWDGYIALLAAWNRILSAAEIRALATNPWQLFAPLPAPRFYLPTAGAPTDYGWELYTYNPALMWMALPATPSHLDEIVYLAATAALDVKIYSSPTKPTGPTVPSGATLIDELTAAPGSGWQTRGYGGRSISGYLLAEFLSGVGGVGFYMPEIQLSSVCQAGAYELP